MTWNLRVNDRRVENSSRARACPLESPGMIFKVKMLFPAAAPPPPVPPNYTNAPWVTNNKGTEVMRTGNRQEVEGVDFTTLKLESSDTELKIR